ncbi:MAG: hydroxyacylglutathione hydrolase [Halieaceae bacterium]|nr:hydroxyacylglutathione hydrolase [Halieaceae bacterium]
MLKIQPIKAFTDNYIWLLSKPDSREAWVVDPGDAQPVIDTLRSLSLNLAGILVTHHHFDHVGGLAALCEAFQPVVYGPHNPAIASITDRVAAGDTVNVLGTHFSVLAVPGHTLDHIAYAHQGEHPVVFCGDTLFAGGCGRLFEGDPAMMLNSLDSLAALLPSTQVYCAHEYTLANLAFACAVEPDNRSLSARVAQAEVTRRQDEPTVPSHIALELATNPFLRCREASLQASLKLQGKLPGSDPAVVFAAVRHWKDSF